MYAIRSYYVCLTDMRLPDGNGIDLVREIQERHPDMATAVITAHGNMESAIDALKAGAFDFLSKPLDLTGLRELVANVLKLRGQGVITSYSIHYTKLYEARPAGGPRPLRHAPR